MTSKKMGAVAKVFVRVSAEYQQKGNHSLSEMGVRRMKLREHRGSLAESIATSIEIPNTIEAVAEAIRNSIQSSDVEVTNDTVHVEWYVIDERMNPPEVWIVTIDGYGVYGFTDSELVA